MDRRHSSEASRAAKQAFHVACVTGLVLLLYLMRLSFEVPAGARVCRGHHVFEDIAVPVVGPHAAASYVAQRLVSDGTGAHAARTFRMWMFSVWRVEVAAESVGAPPPPGRAAFWNRAHRMLWRIIVAVQDLVGTFTLWSDGHTSTPVAGLQTTSFPRSYQMFELRLCRRSERGAEFDPTAGPALCDAPPLTDSARTGCELPIIFVPGQRGSFRQSFALARDVLVQAAHRNGDACRPRFYALDLGEEWSALSGLLVAREGAFLQAALRTAAVRSSGSSRRAIVVAHSFGGIAARLRSAAAGAAAVITLNSPHRTPPLPFDRELRRIYAALNAEDGSQAIVPDDRSHAVLISLSSGVGDRLISPAVTDAGSLRGAVVGEYGGAAAVLDHDSILSCPAATSRLASVIHSINEIGIDKAGLLLQEQAGACSEQSSNDTKACSAFLHTAPRSTVRVALSFNVLQRMFEVRRIHLAAFGGQSRCVGVDVEVALLPDPAAARHSANRDAARRTCAHGPEERRMPAGPAHRAAFLAAARGGAVLVVRSLENCAAPHDCQQTHRDLEAVFSAGRGSARHSAIVHGARAGLIVPVAWLDGPARVRLVLPANCSHEVLVWTPPLALLAAYAQEHVLVLLPLYVLVVACAALALLRALHGLAPGQLYRSLSASAALVTLWGATTAGLAAALLDYVVEPLCNAEFLCHGRTEWLGPLVAQARAAAPGIWLEPIALLGVGCAAVVSLRVVLQSVAVPLAVRLLLLGGPQRAYVICGAVADVSLRAYTAAVVAVALAHSTVAAVVLATGFGVVMLASVAVVNGRPRRRSALSRVVECSYAFLTVLVCTIIARMGPMLAEWSLQRGDVSIAAPVLLNVSRSSLTALAVLISSVKVRTAGAAACFGTVGLPWTSRRSRVCVVIPLFVLADRCGKTGVSLCPHCTILAPPVTLLCAPASAFLMCAFRFATGQLKYYLATWNLGRAPLAAVSALGAACPRQVLLATRSAIRSVWLRECAKPNARRSAH